MDDQDQISLFSNQDSNAEREPRTLQDQPLASNIAKALNIESEVIPQSNLSSEERQRELDQIKDKIGACKNCPLHESRTNTVPGEGCLSPDIMFIGEAPGADEDLQGRPFVGRAGQLLTKMIEAMGYTREEVFIANILKCRPPGNRTPNGGEMELCLPFLERQIELIQPKLIVTLGKTAFQGLLKRSIAITRMRGQWQKYHHLDLMPTYHPSYLLRPPITQQKARKKEVWEDLKSVLEHLEKKVPSREKG